SLFSDASRFPQLPTEHYDEKLVSPELASTLAAAYELFQLGLLKIWKKGEDSPAVVFGANEMPPAHLVLSDAGGRLFDLAGLGAIAESNELARLADLFGSAI